MQSVKPDGRIGVCKIRKALPFPPVLHVQWEALR